jgi:DhnA family fructose-bisphosphate aldolase class Ia
MADVGKAIRLRRILKRGKQKALIVAFDHALMVGALPGMSDPALQVKRFTEAGVDGILLNLGILRHCADSLCSDAPPAVILGLDWTNVWQQNNDHAFSKLVAGVEDALR